MRRKYYLILALFIFPLWIVGATREIRDSFLLQKEGTRGEGKILSGTWKKRRSGPYLDCEISRVDAGNESRKNFNLPLEVAEKHVDNSGVIDRPVIAIRYAPSRLETWDLVDIPPDSPWLSLAVACFGFVLFGGIYGYAWFTAKK